MELQQLFLQQELSLQRLAAGDILPAPATPTAGAAAAGNALPTAGAAAAGAIPPAGACAAEDPPPAGADAPAFPDAWGGERSWSQDWSTWHGGKRKGYWKYPKGGKHGEVPVWTSRNKGSKREAWEA